MKQTAGHKGYHKIYITTPSSMACEAYPLCDGLDEYGKAKPRDEAGNIINDKGKIMLRRFVIADRLVQNSEVPVLEGKSYRQRENSK